MALEQIKDKDGKDAGTWEYYCESGQNTVTVLGLGNHTHFAAGSDVAELIKLIAELAIPILDILGIPQDQQEKAKRLIDVVVKAVPGVDIDVWAGTIAMTSTIFCDPTKTKDAPARHLSFTLFEGLLIVVHAKTSGIGVDSETRYVARLIAEGTHDCNCPATGEQHTINLPAGKPTEAPLGPGEGGSKKGKE